jgi:hypothetical protein
LSLELLVLLTVFTISRKDMIISLALQNMEQLLAHLSFPYLLLGMSSTVLLEHLEKPILISQLFYQLTM